MIGINICRYIYHDVCMRGAGTHALLQSLLFAVTWCQKWNGSIAVINDSHRMLESTDESFTIDSDTTVYYVYLWFIILKKPE